MPFRTAACRDMKPGIVTGAARWKTVMAVGGLALLAAGCGSGSGTSSGSVSITAPSSSTTGSSAASPSASVLCADAAALRAALDKFRHLSVGIGTAGQITADLSDLKAALATFEADARAQYQAQTSALN